jgi:hypothetical protein
VNFDVSLLLVGSAKIVSVRLISIICLNRFQFSPSLSYFTMTSS